MNVRHFFVRRALAILSLLAMLPACVTDSGLADEADLDAGAPYVESIIEDLAANDTAIQSFRSSVRFELESPDVSANEAAISELEFVSRDELLARRDQLETWSQICVDGLTELGL